MPKKTTLSLVSLVLCAFLLLTFSPSVQAEGATQGSRIAVLPFKVNAAKDMTFLRNGLRDMMASRLASRAGAKVISKTVVDKAIAASLPDSAESILALGRNLGVDYVLSGSMTSFAGSLSLDAALHPLKADAPTLNFSTSAPKEEEIISAIDDLSWQIAEKGFGKQRPSGQAQLKTATIPAPAPQPAYQTSHPDRAYMGNRYGGAGVNLVRPLGVVNSPLGFSKTQNMQFGMVSMDVGDVDGDGQQEYVMVSRQEVRVYRPVGNRLQKLGQVVLKNRRFKIHAVTVADLDNNGLAEIYVSAADSKNPRSSILEWNGSEFAYLAKNLNWYLRAVEVPNEGMVLFGQKSSINSLLSKSIYRLTRQGTKVIQGEKLAVRGVNLFDFSLGDLDGNGTNEVVAISQGDRLLVLRPSGRDLWISEDYYGGTTKFIGGEGPDDVAKNLEYGYDAPRIYIPARIIIRDINNDGQQDVIINRNISNVSRVMARVKSYPSGEIHALTWNGLGLTELWRTRKIDGYIVDYNLGPLHKVEQENKDGKKETVTTADLHVGLLLRNSGLNILKNSASTVLTFPLSLGQSSGL